MKGQTTIPFTVIEAATTMLILLSLAYGTQAHTNEFVKQETLQLQVDRVTNAALALNSAPKGFVEVDLSGYGIKYQPPNITMNYSGEISRSEIDTSMVKYDEINGPSNFKTLNGTLCLQKSVDGTDKVLTIAKGEC
jgi:hypothetical protein